jgi:hypothetical protein
MIDLTASRGSRRLRRVQGRFAGFKAPSARSKPLRGVQGAFGAFKVQREKAGHSISPLSRTFLIAVITACCVFIPAIGRTSPPGILRGRRVSLLSANSQPDRYVYPTSGEEISYAAVHHSLSRLLSSERGPGLSHPELFHSNVANRALSVGVWGRTKKNCYITGR